MRNARFLAVIFVIGFLVFIVTSPLRAVLDLKQSGFAGFALYFAGTLFFLAKLSQRKDRPFKSAILVFLLGAVAIEGPMRLIDPGNTAVSLPDFLLRIFGIALAIGMFLTGRRGRLALAGLAVVLLGATYFWAIDLWFHKLNFGTYTSNVSYRPASPFEAVGENGSVIRDSDLRGKITVLDFWNTRCGVCFRKFPKLQRVYEKYRNHPSVTIIAANHPLYVDKPGDAFRVIREEGHTFPVAVMKSENAARDFGVRLYPTVLILDPTGTVVFKGDIDEAERKIEVLLKQQKP
jgi:thiol-disulfide isomerase/thioredoxin